MTQEEENKIFKQSIAPVMDRLGKVHPSKDMYFVAVVSELRKKNIPLDNNLVNMMLDKMARDSMPKGSWDYISGKILDGNIVKTVFDWTHPSAADTPLETEIKRRAELMYNASGTEKVIASLGTAGTDALATAPVAVLCPQSVAYGFLVQGGYDVVNEKVLLPESKEERASAAKSAVQHYNALEEKSNWNIIPGWMYSTQGVTDIKNASEKKLTAARDWAKRNAQWWHDEYDKLGSEHKESALVNGKTFTRQECLVKYNQYDKFRGVCQAELTGRFLAEQKEKEQQRKEALASQTAALEGSAKEDNTDENKNAETLEKTDYWGELLKGLGFNGLGNVGKHLGYTLATMPDMLFNMFNGKSTTTGFDTSTLIPLASLFIGNKINNPLLKVALMGYGGLNLVNRLGNESLSKVQGKNDNDSQAAKVQYKRYEDEELNSRIRNLQIKGNRLIADIDRVPCTVTLSNTIVKAYQSGALPLNTLANAILQRNDAVNQNVSQTYEQSQSRETSRGIR